ncbi:hypothetical protein TNCV_3633641 [Trichonephila clavipes]|nr:hypothetical protein TNCV_3633641 [Trichonephila clavipes]
MDCIAATYALQKREDPKCESPFMLPPSTLVGSGRRGRQLQGMTDISSCRRKEADGSQQASLLSNSVQQRGGVYCG